MAKMFVKQKMFQILILYTNETTHKMNKLNSSYSYATFNYM